ncbi:hypothetical protein ACFJIW_15800 [Tahibacter sp. UC22_41]|uniref:hypothetical protein n=1 Tax=Tahibacter sp. UC22_41 TaxID=3350178 RepID=UPI0036DDFE11
MRDRELQRRWQQQLDALDAQQEQVRRRRRNAVLDEAIAGLALCEAIELGQRNAADWQALSPGNRRARQSPAAASCGCHRRRCRDCLARFARFVRYGRSDRFD